MSQRARTAAASGVTGYEIRLAGHLGDQWSDRLGNLAISRNHDGTTTLTGEVADQARLHGILAGLRDIGAGLLELRATPHRPVRRPGRSSGRCAPRASPCVPHGRRRRRHMGLPAARPVNEWLTGPPDRVEDHRELFADPARLGATVVVQLGHEPEAPVIGDLMLRREDAWAQPEVADRARGAQAELGWVLDPAHTGHGYATEAVRELLRHAVEDLGVHRVTASCFLGRRRLLAPHGTRRHAPRDARGPRVPAPLRPVARRRRLRPAGRRVAGHRAALQSQRNPGDHPATLG